MFSVVASLCKIQLTVFSCSYFLSHVITEHWFRHTVQKYIYFNHCHLEFHYLKKNIDCNLAIIAPPSTLNGFCGFHGVITALSHPRTTFLSHSAAYSLLAINKMAILGSLVIEDNIFPQPCCQTSYNRSVYVVVIGLSFGQELMLLDCVVSLLSGCVRDVDGRPSLSDACLKQMWCFRHQASHIEDLGQVKAHTNIFPDQPVSSIILSFSNDNPLNKSMYHIPRSHEPFGQIFHIN